VREVIIGGFVCPTLFAILWFSVFGGLAIKMERTAELALQTRPDIQHGMVTCAEHYSGGVPITPQSKQLAQAGYYLLSCIPRDDQIYRVMEPYTNLTGFLHFFLWVGLVIYFLTSSDSGSMTDDIISASGLSASKIPGWQKIFWCWTEGLVAIALVTTMGQTVEGGGARNALRSLQHVSIIIGLPYTFILCVMVPSLYRILKKEMGDEDIVSSKRFNTQLLDFFEAFSPKGGSPYTPMQHVINILVGLLVPFVGVKAAFAKTEPEAPTTGLLYAISAQALFLAFFILHICEIGTKNISVIAWLCYFGFTSIIGFARLSMRYKYNIWGSAFEDFIIAITFYPFALAQIVMQAENDGEGMPGYFDSADEMIKLMGSSGTSTQSKTSTKDVALKVMEASNA